MIHNSDIPITRLPMNKIGVVGAGTMGSAIAQHFLMKGLQVTLVDQTDDYLIRGVDHIKQSLFEAKDRRIISEQQFDNILARLNTSTSQADLANCELIVEAVFEDLTVKKTLFAQLEEIVSADCILASNTSSFLVTDIAADLEHPQRLVGVHYFYHAAKNKLVELIAGEQTSNDIITRLMDFYRYVDKTPILVEDAAGFAVNRFFVPWLNEGVRLLEEGFGSIQFIDEVACDVFGVGMGPFALMNATGVPIAQHAAEGLADKLGGFYAPAKLLIKQVSSGNQWQLDDEKLLAGGSNNPAAIKQRLVGATLGVAAQMVSEGVVDATSADLGARSGLRWPMGPFELIDKLSQETVSDMVNQVFSSWDMPMPECLLATEKNKAIDLNWVTQQVIGNTGFIQFNLPDRMNPLGEQTMTQLNDCVEILNSNKAIDKIFILGEGKAFVAGADIKFFLDSIDANNLDRIQSFTEFGHQVFNKISASSKTTYAYLDGLALGGGFELALACDYRIATRKTVIAFPETGIGIYPGLGGTQRTSRLIGEGPAKYLIATGQFVNTDKACQLGLVDEVIDPIFNINELTNYHLDKAQSGMNQNVLSEFDFSDFDGNLTARSIENPNFKACEKILSRKAPLALRMAMDLVAEGIKVSLEKGLELELKGLKTIFASKDAKAGLSSILTGQKPEYAGE